MSDLSKLTNAELVSAFDEITLVLPPFNKRARALLREAASRLQAPAVAEVEVKPLEWDEDHGYMAYNCLFGYHVAVFSNDVVVLRGPLVRSYRFASIDQAKAAAQADCTARVRSALRTGGSE